MSGAHMPDNKHRAEGARRGDRVTGALVSAVVAAMSIGGGVAVASKVSDGDDVARSPVAGSTARTGPEETGPGQTGPADGPASDLGELRVNGESSTVVLQVRRVGAPAGRRAPEGREWYGVRARTCMDVDAGSPRTRLAWSDWSVAAGGRTFRGQQPAWTDFPAQQYDGSVLAPGECGVGWVLVAVPSGTARRVVEVAYARAGAVRNSWRV